MVVNIIRSLTWTALPDLNATRERQTNSFCLRHRRGDNTLGTLISVWEIVACKQSQL